MRYNGWSIDNQEEEIDLNKAEAQARQDEIDAILKPLFTEGAIKALEYIKDNIIRKGIAGDMDTNVAIGRKQGRLDLVNEILINAERVNNGRS